MTSFQKLSIVQSSKGRPSWSPDPPTRLSYISSGHNIQDINSSTFTAKSPGRNTTMNSNQAKNEQVRRNMRESTKNTSKQAQKYASPRTKKPSTTNKDKRKHRLNQVVRGSKKSESNPRPLDKDKLDSGRY